jgi:beta-N-acetylhexosaminidase
LRVFGSVCLLLLTACATTPRVRDLSLDEKVGQLFVPSARGIFLNETSSEYQRLERLVREQHIGGVMWSLSNVYESAYLTRRLQSASRVPLLISADLEAGMGMRFADTTYWPPAMALAATGDPSLAEREGKQVATEALAIGVNQLYAPVADVNVNADNPVINTRSFGEDSHDVARYVAAFTRGVRSAGALATAKHFPGHGDTQTDSHRSLPVLGVTRERLDEVELVPFRAAIEAGVDSVMLGHLSIPVLDSAPLPMPPPGFVADNRYAGDPEEFEQATMPATLSQPIIEGLLRKQLGFQGLVVTDAFDMRAVTGRFPAGEAAVRAIEAGVDIILMPTNIDAAIAGVKDAVKSGRIPMSRLDASVSRILAAKQRIRQTPIDPDTIFRVVDSRESRALAREVAAKAITLVREESGALPLSRDASVALLTVSDFAELANPVWELERELTQRLARPPARFLLDARSCEPDYAAAVAGAQRADVVLLALAIRTRSGHGRITIPDAARRAIEQILAGGTRVVAVSFGTPYLLRDLPSLQTYLCAYGVQPSMQIAAARALFGEAAIGGKLPVTIPGLYARGHGVLRP